MPYKIFHELNFEKNVTNLTGNKLGRKIYSEQVKPYIDEKVENVVTIPLYINDVGTSFIQGMYAEIRETHGREKALELMKMDCENKEILEKINKSIRIYGI